MRKWTTLIALAATLTACSSGSGKVDDDDEGAVDDVDTGVPADTDSDGDTDTDTDTDGDTDTDDDTDDDTDIGTDPIDCSLDGRAYTWDLVSATWVQPAGVGSLLGGFLEELPVMGVTATTPTEIESVFGLPSTDACIEFPTADFSGDPVFSIGPEDALFDLGGSEVTIVNLEVRGAFEADCSAIRDGSLEGQLDVREIAGSLGFGDAATTCGLLVSFGASCVACDSDGEALCLDVELVDVPAGETDPLSCMD
ncbi:MAG: hypothetical protein VX000_17005 [Myxococcota bacterium]|nr:hypothetical protein [Myxococcota bacterium]